MDTSGGDWLDTDGLQELRALRRSAPPDRTGLLSAPPGGVAAGGEGSAYRVFRARGERIDCRTHDGNRWSTWSEVGSLKEEPVGLATWQQEFDSLGRPFEEVRARRISAGSRGAGHQEVFVEAASGEPGHIWWQGGWQRSRDAATGLGSGWWRFRA